MHYEEDNEGGSFLLGLLAGAVLGVGIGMLFAPRAGTETRRRVSESAQRFQKTASDRYGRASEHVSHLVDRGRETYDKARHSVKRGVEEARRYAGDTADTARSYANKAADTAKSYADRAAERASEAVDNARDHAREAADSANATVHDIASRVERG